MSITGTYKFDPEVGEVVKVSDDIPAVTHDVSLGGKEDYYDEHLGHWDEKTETYKPYHVTSKKDKKRRMKELGLTEKGGPAVKCHGKTNYHDMTVKGRATVFVGRR